MLACIGIPQRAYQNMTDKVSESVGLEEGQRIYICDKFPSDFDAASLGTVFHLFKKVFIWLLWVLVVACKIFSLGCSL